VNSNNSLQSADFDPTIQRIVDQLAAEPLVSVSVLRDELEQYADEQQTHTSNAERFGDGIEERLVALCRKLLNALPDQPSERQHRLTQIAINYFVLAEDANDDNHSLIGLDDDLQVVTAAIKELGLEQLLEE
jgi:uncharacterized membrane protein YkvA (DUF1232 family)